MEKQNLYGFVTRLPKDESELAWRTTGYSGTNPEGCYQYEFSDMVGWKQPIFTQLDFEFFSKKPNDYRVEAVAGREARPQRPVREEVKPGVDAPKPEPVAAKVETVLPKVEATSKRMGRPPKAESNVGV